MRIEELRVNHVEQPMGYDYSSISLSWKYVAACTEAPIEAVEICIWEGKKEDFHNPILKKQVSMDANQDCPVDIKVKPRTRYYFSVTAQTAEENVSAQSWFETGKEQETWHARWIAVSDGFNGEPVFQKKFSISQEIKESRIYIVGLGLYEIYLNGRKVGKEYLAPGYHSYDCHVQVYTYDLTEYLSRGENVIQILMGSGWYKGRIGFDGGYTEVYGDRCYVLAELYLNGERILSTDKDWEYRPSPVLFSGIYDGEIYDARMEEACAGDEGWSPVVEKKPELTGSFSSRFSLPVVGKERFAAKLLKTPKGELILDFSQNLTGWVEFKNIYPKGTRITLTASEVLQNGCFYNDNFRTAKAQFTFISDGIRRNVRPHFTFFGFQYMKVEGLETVEPENFTAVHLRSDFDETGWLTTGNPKINRLISNVLWSQKDNFLDVPTDCPQRDERLGWTGDAQIFSETACLNMYVPAFFRKYLWDMRAEQELHGGSVPNVIPSLKHGMVASAGMSPWADSAAVIPWNIYEAYGDRTLLAECYPGMKAWVEHVRKEAGGSQNPWLVSKGMHFGDWLALDNDAPGPLGATDSLYIASAYYFRSAQLVSQAAEVLGYEKDFKEYYELARNIRCAIREAYFGADGLCVCKTQTGAALAIAFRLCPGSLKAQGDELEQLVVKKNYHLDTGFVGTPILCAALTESGHHDTAVKVFLQENCPGWLYEVNMGATTIWERWDSILPDGSMNPEGMNSLNHYSYGSIIAWMYRYLCGIHPEKPGYRKVKIQPFFSREIGEIDGKLLTPAGSYGVAWKYKENGKISLSVSIPYGAYARVIFGKTEQELYAGDYKFEIEEGEIKR